MDLHSWVPKQGAINFGRGPVGNKNAPIKELMCARITGVFVSSIGGLVVEYSPATRVTRVRFPVDARSSFFLLSPDVQNKDMRLHDFEQQQIFATKKNGNYTEQPPGRIELPTPGLQDQCSSHWAMEATHKHWVFQWPFAQHIVEWEFFVLACLYELKQWGQLTIAASTKIEGSKIKYLPRVRIELTTFRWLYFLDYETDALPTALSRHGSSSFNWAIWPNYSTTGYLETMKCAVGD